MQAWRGKVTQLIPPHYGIIDGTAFYVTTAIAGSITPQVRRSPSALNLDAQCFAK